MLLRRSAILALTACAKPAPHPTTAPTLPAPTHVAARPPPPPRPTGVTRGWERWPEWATLEVGSAAFATRVDDTWGGLAELGRGQLAMLVPGATAATTLAALHPLVDAARPMRVVAGARGTWAVLVGANASTASVPAHCERIEAAIACGTDLERGAVRDDYFARGLVADAADALHGEQVARDEKIPAHAVVDAHERDGALRATIVATPRRAPTGTISAAAIAAGSRVQGRSPRVELGAFQGFATDLASPLQFARFDIVVDGYTVLFGEQVFVEQPVDRVAPHMVALWRAESGTRVDATPPPPGMPKGTRRFHRRTWTHDSGEILACAPDRLDERRVMGGCRVVGHRPATTTLSNDADFVFIPADGGTWITSLGDPHVVTAIARWVAEVPAVPPVWTLPAVAAGRASTPRATVWWAQHLDGNGDLTTELVGATPPTP